MTDSTGGDALSSGHAIGFMNGLDALFLYLESPETPMHVGSLHVFDPPAGGGDGLVDALRAHLATRLDAADVFTRRLAPMPLGLANPAWIRAAEVDLDHHVRRVRLPAPGSMAQLHDFVASRHAVLLDRSRPLWEMVVIEGLADGRIGFYAKVHHAGLDGQAGVALAQAVYALGPTGHGAPGDASPPPRGPVATGGEEPGIVRVAAAGVRHNVEQLAGLAARAPGLLRSVAQAVAPALGGGGEGGGAGALLGGEGLLAPRTVLNAAISRRRAFCTLSVPIERARAIAQRHDASLNDVVLAAVGHALRDWLEARGELPAESLLAAMPVSLRRAGDTSSNTQAMMARMTLATDVADPVERLRRIRDASGRIKGALREVKSAVPTEFPSLGLPWLGNALAGLWGRGRLANRLPPLANVIVSNVPGPAVPLWLLGARMGAYWPVSIPYHGVALNVTVQSYAGSLDFGLIACRRAVPDIDAIAGRLAAAFDALDAPPPAKKRRRRPAAPESGA